MNGSCMRLDSLTAPVGMLPELPPHQRTIQLPAESRLLIASDGISEAWNTRDEEFGDARLLELVSHWNAEEASEFCKRVIDTVADFTQDRAQSDDMTLIATQVIA